MNRKLKYSVDSFFNLFEEELANSPFLHNYYKFYKRDKNYHFRKAYFIQRLQYIASHVKPGNVIWDCGCGYGTTAIFLALNGYKILGTTLEFYFADIDKRLRYWSKFGDLSQLTINYENIFDVKPIKNEFNTIIVQDTLHHLEPLDEALSILSDSLHNNGQIIAIEENGSNFIQNLKLYKHRRNKRVITIYDVSLKKDILLGNENIRSFNSWKIKLASKNLIVDESSLQYIRIIPPQLFNSAINQKIKIEQSIAKRSSFLRKYFFFGINFIATKTLK